MRVLSKEFFKKVSVVLLILFLLIPNFGFTFSQLNNFSANDKPHTFTQVYYENQSGRGFTWCTGTNFSIGLAQIAEEKEGRYSWDRAMDLDVTSFKQKGLGSYSTQSIYVHKASVENLSYGSTYHYRVGAEKVDLEDWIEGSFTVRSADDFVENGVSFFQITDTQAGDLNSYMTHLMPTMKAAYKKFNPDFILHTGDVTDNNWSGKANLLEFHWTHDILNETGNLPVLMASTGNHDSQDEIFNKFYNYSLPDEAPTKTGIYYSYDVGNVHIVNVDTNQSGFNQARGLDKLQVEWIEADLKNTKADFIVVQTHKGPYSYGKHYDDREMPFIRDQLMPLLDEYDVDLFLNGHDHIYSRSKPMVWNESKKAAEVNDKLVYNKTINGYNKNDNGTIHVSLIPAGSKREILPYEGWETSDGGKFDKAKLDYLDSLMDVNSVTSKIAHDTFIESAHDGEMKDLCMFSNVSVKGDTLTYDVYTVNKTTEEILLYDSVNIKKEISYVTAAQLRVNNVIALINQLPSSIKISDESAILSVRMAYDKLSAEEKNRVTNYNNLEKAEKDISKLISDKNTKKKNTIITIVILSCVGGILIIGGGIFVIIFLKKKKAAEKK